MKHRYENFGGIIASDAPPFLAFVDRQFMRDLGLPEMDAAKTIARDDLDAAVDAMGDVERAGRQAEPHLGLGLYLVRLISEFHRGSVTAEDVEDAAQVRVTMRLPCT